MPIIESETDRSVATPSERDERSALGRASTAKAEAPPRSAQHAHGVTGGLRRLRRRVGLALAAAFLSIPVGCEVSDTPPPPLDSSNGSSSGTSDDSDGPLGGTSTGNPAADSTTGNT